VASTDAIALLLLLHVPPAVASVSVVVVVEQTDETPPIAAGVAGLASTVIDLVVFTEPHELVKS
jgi:hypothetical protein